MRTGARAISIMVQVLSPKSPVRSLTSDVGLLDFGPSSPDCSNFLHVRPRLIRVISEIRLALRPGQVFVYVLLKAALRFPAERAQFGNIRDDVTGVAEPVFTRDLWGRAAPRPRGDEASE